MNGYEDFAYPSMIDGNRLLYDTEEATMDILSTS
jgi:hypothetical protein